MKAKEYLEKFKDYPELNLETLKPIQKLAIDCLIEIVLESNQLNNQRKSGNLTSIFPIFKELNDKFRAFNNLLTKKYRNQILMKNAFWTFIKKEMKPIWTIFETYIDLSKKIFPDEMPD